ncbi:MAG: rRNA maturation RNase YbeY [Candidatus Brocadiaceae bacterium]
MRMRCKLEIINTQRLCAINKKKIKNLVQGVLKIEEKDAELNIVFTDNKKIKEINKTFLRHNYATDVISFPYHESSISNIINGEIVVSAEKAIEVSQKHGYEAEGEIALYVIHGLLHLLGYDDKQKKEAKKMHQRERELLLHFGYNVPMPV